MSAGYTTFPNQAATNAAIATLQGNQYVTSKFSLTSAQILQLNTTPVQLLPAPGANKVYSIIQSMFRLNFNTTAYAATPTFRIVYASTSDPIFTTSLFLQSTVLKIIQLPQFSGSATPTSLQIGANQPVSAFIATANPTLGNSGVDIWLTWCIKDVT